MRFSTIRSTLKKYIDYLYFLSTLALISEHQYCMKDQTKEQGLPYLCLSFTLDYPRFSLDLAQIIIALPWIYLSFTLDCPRLPQLTLDLAQHCIALDLPQLYYPTLPKITLDYPSTVLTEETRDFLSLQKKWSTIPFISIPMMPTPAISANQMPVFRSRDLY